MPTTAVETMWEFKKWHICRFSVNEINLYFHWIRMNYFSADKDKHSVTFYDIP